MGTWDHHCPNCFSEKTDGKRQCQSCGYDEGESRSPAALPLRTILSNQYVVGRVLGNPGGFGITYLCWDIKLANRVAIKEYMPRDKAVRDKDRCNVLAHGGKGRDFFEYGLKAFLAEARTVASFNHPNIVRVKNYFEHNHTAYLVMDYYEGVSLAEYVKQQGGRLLEKAALEIMGFVLDGLRHVHDRGYLHRDVKPANIYLTGKGQVILLDFGTARYAMGEYNQSLSVVVTPGFSPLEQYSTKGKQGPCTDIYASGAMLYYMLTGNLLESAPDRVLSDTLAEPGQLPLDMSPGVSKGLMLALQISASDRPQSIEELKNILTESPPSDPEDNIKKTEEKSDEIENREEEKKPAIPLWRRKKAIALGLSLLVLMVIVYGNWSRQGVLVVTPHPEDAEVWVDGVNHGRGRLRLEKVNPGKRVVSVKRSGYASDEKTVEIVAGLLSDVEIHLALLQGALKITTVPSGAEVSVNGIVKGKTPVEVSGLSPGAVKVRVSSEGYETKEESVDVVGGEKRLVWGLQKAVGVLRVVTEPSGAEVSVNGIVKGKSPVEVPALSPGAVKVRVISEGYVTKEESVDVVGGEKRQVEWILQKAVGVLRVVTEPSGAEVSVNGVVKGKSPVEVQDIKPGPAKVRVSMNTKEYAVREEVVSIEVGQELVLEWKLQQVKKNVEIEAVREMPVEQDMAPANPKIGELWKDPVTGMKFVWVPGGCYQMGCGSWDGDCQSDEKPVHEVCLDGFWIGQTEVTQGQWQRVMGSNPSFFNKNDDCPVEMVSWRGAKEYIQKLNGMGIGKFRLPSEAEWEYAARSGGKAEKYSGGHDVDSVAWCSNNRGSTRPVKTKKSNGLGIYDMSGNVGEWCEDVYIADIYSRSDRKNPIYTNGSFLRVIRGGSWRFEPDYARCADRYPSGPAFQSNYIGIRLLRMP